MRKKKILQILICILMLTVFMTLPAGASETGEGAGQTEESEKAERELSLCGAFEMTYGETKELSFGSLGTEDIVSDAEAALSFSSSDQEILTVEQTEPGKVKITAIGLGDALLYVKAAETESYKAAEGQIAVHVKSGLAAPVFKENKLLSGGIYLSWEKVLGAEGYKIERKTNSGSYQAYQLLSAMEEPSFTDKKVTPGETYSYRIRAVSGADQSDTVTAKFLFIKPPVLKVWSDEKGIRLDWDRPTGSGGYRLYRKTVDGSYSLLFSTSYAGETAYTDTKAVSGVKYIYMVKCVNGSTLSAASASKAYARLSAPTIKSWKRKNASSMTLTWKKQSQAAGYEVQYTRNALFLGTTKVVIKSASKTSYTAARLQKKKTYWVRIRSYKTIGGVKYYSPWTVSANVYSAKTMKAVQLKKGKTVIDINALAKQGINGHSIMEGSCSDGSYCYYLLARASTKTCLIVKVKKSNMTLVKVSKALALDHGNDMTYDSAKKQLVIIHSTGDDPKKLTKVNPKTLTIINSQHVSIPQKLSGGSLQNSIEATAFSSIAYSNKRKAYAILLSHNYNFVITDSELRPVHYVKVNKKLNYTIQGIDATDDYIIIAQSPKKAKQYNILTVYTWNGKFVCRLNVKKGYEIESIYHIGSQIYATFYRSYKVKVKGKYVRRRSGYVYRLSFK